MKGICASPGLAAAKPFLVKEQELRIRRSRVPKDAIEAEKEKFYSAVERLRQKMNDFLSDPERELSEDERKIMGVHVSLLDDPSLIDETVSIIENERFNCAYALSQNVDAIALELGEVDDEYIRERIMDIKDVSTSLLKRILDVEPADLTRLEEDVILIARDLEPSQLISADKRFLRGIVCEQGGVTSHTAILARNLGVPAVFGVRDAMKSCRNVSMLVVNGTMGTVDCNPEPEELDKVRRRIESLRELRQDLGRYATVEGRSLDGRRMEVCANIGSAKDAAQAVKNGAEGAGLFRTEFMFMQEDVPPSEEIQFETYKAAAEALGTRPLIIRTLDAGGDKEIEYLHLNKENNPFLGYRAIRICLKNKDLFKTQLRAILRASAYGNIRIMYPMISSIEELHAANRVLKRAKAELRREGVPFDREIKVGIMVEIPTTAVCADIFAREVDFFSIGTNDLIQYTLAVDRTNQTVSALYDEYNPGVLRLIYHTIQSGAREGKPVGMCGEMGGNLLLTPLLLGMGIDEVSVSPVAVPKVKKMLSAIDSSTAQRMLHRAMCCDTGSEMKAFLTEELTKMKLDHLLLL
ncbi:phosphoenolpyruvate--protein phosphotransferase [Anaerotruncus rubiinfantis]|uniref:phosphoenolpyruvate--protein phosphotransferase n=3 Tax=Anaerotruncus rubiinfantis TaxID=1720200 RepID=UPI00082DB8AC|nr:phosphoenolpyruvate--protein phosphotransferase [Anaerotruncus rubiinfantis]